MSDVAATTQPADGHPIGLVVTDDLRRSRLTVFFRSCSRSRAFIWLALWAIVVEIGALHRLDLGALHRVGVPDGMHSFLGELRSLSRPA